MKTTKKEYYIRLVFASLYASMLFFLRNSLDLVGIIGLTFLSLLLILSVIKRWGR